MIKLYKHQESGKKFLIKSKKEAITIGKVVILLYFIQLTYNNFINETEKLLTMPSGRQRN